MHVLQPFHQTTGLKANHSKSQIVFGGCSTQLQQSCLRITGFHDGTLPLTYLGVPITASKLGKVECRTLVEKIMGKIKLWSSRSLTFARRAQLLNTVVFGMYNFWASIFILPQEVIDQITQLSRNYLWGGSADYKRAPYVSWKVVCSPKKYGGLGLENLAAWNKASIAKLVWFIALKKDIL